MRELGRRGAAARWQKEAERKAAAAAAPDADPHAPGGKGGEALNALLAVLRAKDAPHAAVVAAARALLDAEAGASVTVPTTVEAVQQLSTVQLHALIGRLEGTQALDPATVLTPSPLIPT